MQIVPVIDLKGGRVVHARAGERDRYRPIRSTLTERCDPVSVVDALLALHPFDSLYVADLDAIAGAGSHQAELEELGRRFPELDLWVDCGLATETDCAAWLAQGVGRLVVGSESQSDTAVLAGPAARKMAARLILSLDFRGERFLGPAEILNDAGLWPERVIVMTLGRVGGTAGPDIERLRSLQIRHPDQAFYAAGGVRSAADLRELAALGASGALVASALHDGRLAPSDLAASSAEDPAS